MIVGKISMIDEAKITGITPAMFTLSGMKVLVPPIMRRPTTRLAYCTGTRRSPVVIQMTAITTARAMTAIPICDRQAHVVERAQTGGQTRDDADEDDDRHAVADAARGDQLAEPHHDHRARGERDDDEIAARTKLRFGSAPWLRNRAR